MHVQEVILHRVIPTVVYHFTCNGLKYMVCTWCSSTSVIRVRAHLATTCVGCELSVRVGCLFMRDA